MGKIIRIIRYDWPLHFLLQMTNWLPDNVFFLRFRGYIVRPFFKNCCADLRIGRNLTFYNPSNISIGKSVYIAYGCWFAAGGTITIGDEVMFGPYVVTASGDHTKVNNSYRFGESDKTPVIIGKGSWIGAHANILSGVSIGKASVVGSGATVVRGEYPDNSFLAGVPAKVKKINGDTIH